jgi:hypothetical protein
MQKIGWVRQMYLTVGLTEAYRAPTPTSRNVPSAAGSFRELPTIISAFRR